MAWQFWGEGSFAGFLRRLFPEPTGRRELKAPDTPASQPCAQVPKRPQHTAQPRVCPGGSWAAVRGTTALVHKGAGCTLGQQCHQPEEAGPGWGAIRDLQAPGSLRSG